MNSSQDHRRPFPTPQIIRYKPKGVENIPIRPIPVTLAVVIMPLTCRKPSLFLQDNTVVFYANESLRYDVGLDISTVVRSPILKLITPYRISPSRYLLTHEIIKHPYSREQWSLLKSCFTIGSTRDHVT